MRTLGIDPEALILEPCGRNTAPAVAVAALQSVAKGDDPILLVLPADHLIADVARFQRAVAVASAAAEEGKLVTFGIVPDKPETGYGYIRARQRAEHENEIVPVAQFVEKPDLETATRYLESGDYLLE